MESGTPSSGAQAEPTGDAAFAGSIPEVYERLLVPLIFVEPAARLAETVSRLEPVDVLETAAGTGVLTRALRARLPSASITATDLNEAMLDEARRTSPELGSVDWRPADAQALPFDDASFDVVVCQFGVMFLPDKDAGLAEARRVLRPGGRLAFNVWDGLEANDFPALVHRTVVKASPESPPEFLARTPYGYHDRDRLAADLERAGFRFDLRVRDGVNRGEVRDVATAFTQGTPFRLELDARPALAAGRATELVADALAREFGSGVVQGRSRWLEVVAEPLAEPGALRARTLDDL